jgi:hypothetical protein
MRKQDIAKLAPGTEIAWGYEPCKIGEPGISKGTLVSSEPSKGQGAYARYSVKRSIRQLGDNSIERVRSAQIVGTWDEHCRVHAERAERAHQVHEESERQTTQRQTLAEELRQRLAAIGASPTVTTDEWVDVHRYGAGEDLHFTNEVALIVRGKDIERLLSLAELGALAEPTVTL